MPFFEHRSFWLPKDLRDRDAFQDAYAVDERIGIAAIADGAASSLFAASWARILCKAIVKTPPPVDDAEQFAAWLAKRRAEWRRPIDVQSLAWHQKAKFDDGAHATVLWMMLNPLTLATGQPGYDLHCHAVGDCCFFHLREEQVLRAFPFEQSELFSVNPNTLGSISRSQEPSLNLHRLQDACQPGDLIVLCTDAVALWALQELEKGGSPDFESFWELTDGEYERRLVELRNSQSMRYDDATLILLRIQPPPSDPNTVGAKIDSILGDVKDSLGEVRERVASSSAWKMIEKLRGGGKR